MISPIHIRTRNLILNGFAFFCFFYFNNLSAQVLQNYGSVISAKSGSVITVNGSVLNEAGTIDINQNAGTPAKMYVSQDVTNNSTIFADGHIHLSGNWFDNGSFESTLGTVFMDGATQFLGGSSETIFHNLTLNGSEFKIQQVNKFATGVLSLNHLELKTETFSFSMENTSLNAITRTTGFVSSLNGGFLGRQTNSNGLYLYPVGSSESVICYRPVELTPENATPNQYMVRFANTDATLEGYDLSMHEIDICEANTLFYHQIARTAGIAAADVVINYDPVSDGSWSSLSRWNLSSPLWEKITGSFTSSGMPFFKAQKTNWSNFSDIPYVLTNQIVTPIFSQVPPVCFGDVIPPLPTTSLNGITGTWSPAINNTDTTTYTFTPGIDQCGYTTTMTIIVYPQVLVTITDTSICTGGTAILIATASPAGGDFFWSNANPTSSITVSPTFSTSYSVFYTSLNNCFATATRLLAVNPIPTATATSALICDGEIATIVATGLPTGGTYLWSPSGQTTASINVSPSSTANYSVVYSRLGCESPVVNTVVTVNPVPILNLASEVICIGEDITMTAQTTIAGGVYDWGNGSSNATQTFSPQSDTTLTLTYSVNGCTSPIETATITVNPLPISTFSGSPLTGCIPLEVTLLADDNSNTSYSWSASNGLTGTGAQSSLTFTSGGVYDITLTAGLNGCFTTTTLNNYVAVDNYPIASFVPSSIAFTELSQSLEFTNTSSGANSYTWDFGDGASSTEINPEHNFTDNSNGHTITLVAASTMGCTSTYQISIDFNEVLIYYIPNTFTPDGDGHNQTFKPVFTSGFDPYNYEMLIYNRWGEIIFETHDVTYGWDGTYALANYTCQDGVYLYTIIFKNPLVDERKVVCGSVTLLK
jgi:gliding motility-associated-like protein